MIGSFSELSTALLIVLGLRNPLELDPTLGLLLDIFILRLLSISIPTILSDRNNYG